MLTLCLLLVRMRFLPFWIALLFQACGKLFLMVYEKDTYEEEVVDYCVGNELATTVIIE